jgi:hypothetical protein
VNYESLAHELLETNKCYFLDCGAELYVWMGRTTSLQERKGASEAAEVIFVQLVSYLFSLYSYKHQVTLFENAEESC